MTRLAMIAITFILVFLTSCKQDHVKAKQQVMEVEASIPKSNLSLDYCLGKFNPADSEKFELITQPYAERSDMFLRVEAYEAFQKMYEAAKADGIELIIRSATRNFDYQRRIWENKWTGKTKLSDGVNAATDIPTDNARAY